MTDLKKIWWVSFLVKLLISALIPLSADESYYWVWSQFPHLSYFDHPPMVAWFFKLGSYLPTELVRWPSVILFHLSYLVWFKILKEFFSSKEIFIWFVLCLLCPLTGLGAMVVTPDAPLFVFFSFAVLFFIKAQKSKSTADYIGFGAFLGLSFLSKYIIVIAALLFILSLIIQKEWVHFIPKALLSVFVSGLVFSMPVLIWNWQNDFKSFGFQIHHGLGKNDWQWTWTAEYIVGTLLIIFPLNLIRSFKTPGFPHKTLFSCLAWGGLLFFFISSFRAPVELNWPSIFIPCLFVLTVLGSRASDFKKNLTYWGLIYLALFYVAGTGAVPALQDKFNEPFKAKAWSTFPNDYKPLYASTYQLASLMWWTSQKPVYKLPGMSRYDFYDEIAQEPLDVNAFYLLKEIHNNLPDWVETQRWTVEEINKLDDKHILLRVYRQEQL